MFYEIFSKKNALKKVSLVSSITTTKYKLVKISTLIILNLWYLNNDEHIEPTKFWK